jgi:hypothetical protein
MCSMQCNVEFGYQFSIRSGIEENHGKPLIELWKAWCGHKGKEDSKRTAYKTPGPTDLLSLRVFFAARTLSSRCLVPSGSIVDGGRRDTQTRRFYTLLLFKIRKVR